MPGLSDSDPFDIIDPRFKRLVLPNAPPRILADGFAWLEGPVWFADAAHLLVSDLPNDRIMRWTEQGGISVFRQPSGFANGHARDRAGRLIGCSHQHRCITRTELDGRVATLADRFDGKPLNGPNDLVCRRDGSIWFTDPFYGTATDYEGGKATPELPPTLYRLAPDGGLAVAAAGLQGPNGLCFSPDESLLYVVDSGEQFAIDPLHHILAYPVDGDRLGPSRVFHTVTPGHEDGIRCDEDGNLWAAAGDGVHCIAPDGTIIGRIRLPYAVSNLCFGGRNRAQLFICASHTLVTVFTNTRGVPTV